MELVCERTKISEFIRFAFANFSREHFKYAHLNVLSEAQSICQRCHFFKILNLKPNFERLPSNFLLSRKNLQYERHFVLTDEYRMWWICCMVTIFDFNTNDSLNAWRFSCVECRFCNWTIFGVWMRVAFSETEKCAINLVFVWNEMVRQTDRGW